MANPEDTVDLDAHLEEQSEYLERVRSLDFDGKTDWTAEEITEIRDFLSPWEHNLLLPFDIFTTGWTGTYENHEETMRVLTNHLHGNFSGKRLIDIGCLEGYFTFEAAMHGADAVGVDGKSINVKKCEFLKSVLGVDNISFVEDDAMRVTREKYGGFDVVMCLGLLYHLRDPFTFLANMAELCDGFMVLDTHISLVDQPEIIKGNWKVGLSDLKEFSFRGSTYQGRMYKEFDEGTPQIKKELSSTSSLADNESVWLTDEALIALLHDVGFEETNLLVYPNANTNRWGDIVRECRVLIVAYASRAPFESKTRTP